MEDAFAKKSNLSLIKSLALTNIHRTKEHVKLYKRNKNQQIRTEETL